jgi:hypothetical protein
MPTTPGSVALTAISQCARGAGRLAVDTARRGHTAAVPLAYNRATGTSESMDAVSDQRAAMGQRDHFIPVRKVDILSALTLDGGLPEESDQDKFRQLCRLLGAIFHYEYFDRLERLRDDYFFFNPDHDGHARFNAATVERAYRSMVGALLEVLHGANFIEISHAEIERAHREDAVIRVKIETPMDDYREVRFFRRGHRRQAIQISEWYGWRKREIEADVYDDVVLMVTMKNETGGATPGKRKSRAPRVRPGAVLLKYFRNIASADLNALFPDVRVVMGLRDKLVLGVPALLGGIPILLKVASTVTVLFLVAGFYLGVSSAVRDDEVTAALAGLSGLIALGGFIVRQWVKFQRQSLLYQKQLADNVYFRNVNNNIGIFDYLIGAAEEQDCKEAFLAYCFLLAPGPGPTKDELDHRVEVWLAHAFGTEIDFECDDAVAKLDRLGLLRRDGERLAVLPLDRALARLDEVWDDFFRYPGAAR